MGNIASLLQPLGALFGQKVLAPPPSQTAASGLNTSGSSYDISSGGVSTAPYIQNGISTTQLLLIGGAVLAALFILKRK